MQKFFLLTFEKKVWTSFTKFLWFFEYKYKSWYMYSWFSYQSAIIKPTNIRLIVILDLTDCYWKTPVTVSDYSTQGNLSINIGVVAESIEWSWLIPHRPPPSVSLTGDTQKDWERETTCWRWAEGRGGWGAKSYDCKVWPSINIQYSLSIES